MRDHIKEIEEQLGALEGEFRRANYEKNRVSWRSFVGNPTRFLALHCRAADLVVIGSSPAGSGVIIFALLILELWSCPRDGQF